MIRLLLLLLLGFIVWGVFRFIFRISTFLGLFSSSFPTNKKPKALSEKLVECEVCHTFIPEDKAIRSKNAYYCCQEHALEK